MTSGEKNYLEIVKKNQDGENPLLPWAVLGRQNPTEKKTFGNARESDGKT